MVRLTREASLSLFPSGSEAMGVGDEEGRELLLRAKAVAEEAFEL